MPGFVATLDFPAFYGILCQATRESLRPEGLRLGNTENRTLKENAAMETKRFTFYQEDDMWIGWLEEYPDYRTQGATLEELKENLKDIYKDLTSGEIPAVRKTDELIIR